MRWWRPALLAVLAAAAVAAALTVGVPPIEDVRAWVAAAGWAGPVLYAALFAGLSLTPVPASVLSIGAGALFGLGAGLPVVLVGAIAGAVAGFALARSLGRTTVERIGRERLARLDTMLRRHGLIAMIGIRIAPIVPFAVLNVACGLTAVRARDYVLGSAVGMTPGAAVFVAIGAYGADPTSAPFLISLGALAALVLVGVVVARRRRAPVEPAELVRP